MAFSRHHSFVNFLLFLVLFQKDILNNGADQCLNPKFDKNKKIVVDLYYHREDTKFPGIDLCEIIANSNGLISKVHRMSSDMKEKETCTSVRACVENRIIACLYKKDPNMYNDCNRSLPMLEVEHTDCVCAGAADDILTTNENAFKKLGTQSSPVLVVDNKYDPCFTDYSYDSMKTYFCKAYDNELPLCK